MMNFKEQYRAELDAIELPQAVADAVVRTVRAQNGRMLKKSRMRRLRTIAVLAAALLLSLTVTVSAYTIYQATRPVYQPHITTDSPADVVQAGGGSAAKSGLDITVTGSAADETMLYIDFTVTTADGSPINQTGETRYTGPFQQFKKAELTVGGQTFVIDTENQTGTGGMIMRHDDGSVPETASFEAMFWGDFTGIRGQDATLRLTDFTQRLETCEDAGFAFGSLAEAFVQLTPEPAENFIETGVYAEYADGSTVPSFTIPAGSAHIEFSEQFPGAYIDNMGFHKTGEKGAEHDMLYVSIVPGNEGQLDGLQALGFQALDTRAPLESAYYMGNGLSGTGVADEDYYARLDADHAAKLAHSEGRVVLVLAAPWPDYRDLTEEDLANFRLVKNIGMEHVDVRAAGQWELPLTISAQEELVYAPGQTIELANGGSLTVDSVSISPLRLQVAGTESGMDLKTPFSAPAMVVLKDGTSFVADHKGAAGSWGQGSFSFEWMLDQLVDPDQVAAIEIDGRRIELNAGDTDQEGTLA